MPADGKREEGAETCRCPALTHLPFHCLPQGAGKGKRPCAARHQSRGKQSDGIVSPSVRDLPPRAAKGKRPCAAIQRSPNGCKRVPGIDSPSVPGNAPRGVEGKASLRRQAPDKNERDCMALTHLPFETCPQGQRRESVLAPPCRYRGPLTNHACRGRNRQSVDTSHCDTEAAARRTPSCHLCCTRPR